MARTSAPTRTKRIRAKLNSDQKELRRKKLVDLTNAVTEARDQYEETSRSIAEIHGR
jgi:hypothetical protein